MKLVLHVGCGPADISSMSSYFRDGSWQEIRFDIDAAVSPDIVGSILDMGILESGSFDALFSSHNIEHLLPHEVPVALGEFNRVLKGDGVLVVKCPDLESVAEAIVQKGAAETLYVSPAGPIAALDILYGHRKAMAAGNIYMAHRTAFTAALLQDSLLAAGFAQVFVGRDQIYGLHAIAYKQEVPEKQADSDFQRCVQ